MGSITRRHFLGMSATAALASAVLPRSSFASPYGLPLGLQLYSVRDELPKDYAGTLKAIAALGYREVEAAGFLNHPATEVKQAMSAAGLRCVSGHYPWPQLDGKLDQIIAFHKQIGAEYIVCAYPGHKPGAKVSDSHSFSLDDWRWNAEQYNRAGETVKKAGLRFGYHNHTPEFKKDGGVVPYDELLRLTDPSLVTFEMDCGWVMVGGADPIAYLKKYPNRISMLHVKDFQKGVNPPHAAQLGEGMIDYKPIFAAVKPGQIKHAFVEQEQFDIPWQQALKVDADYITKLKV